MRVLDIITESSGKHLSLSSLTHYETRPKIFADLIRAGHNFTTKNNQKVVIDPNTAGSIETTLTNYVKQKFKGKAIPTGSLDLQIIEIDGKPVAEPTVMKSGELVKDAQIAGAGRGASNVEKEKAGRQMQPSSFFGMKDVDYTTAPDLSQFIEAGAFKAGELYNKIVQNPMLKEMHDKLAAAIVQSANEIQAGQKARLPAHLSTAENRAFRDYATEHLGLLSLIVGGDAIEWAGGDDKSKMFYKHLEKMGSRNLSDLTLYFPGNPTKPLNDSTLISPTGKEMIVSSKAGAGGKGAAPSLDGLTIPDNLRNFKGMGGRNPYTAAIKFIETAQTTSAFLQPFALANLLSNKMTVGHTFGKFDLTELEKSYKDKIITPTVKEYIKKYPNKALGGTPLGKLRYGVAKELMEVVNSGTALTNFKSAVLQILGYNFIQLNTKPIGGQFVTTVNWPATISGRVTLENKYGAGQTGGKLSFMVHA